jgi:hypothetical protein
VLNPWDITMSKSKQPPADPFQSIDPAALGTVSGGAGAGNAEVMGALSGILDSVKSLATQQNSGGMDPMMMMMMMMMMGGGNSGPAPAQQSANPYAGYTVDGVYYPFK